MNFDTNNVGHLAIMAVVIGAIAAVLWVALTYFGIIIPYWVITIFWICVVAFIVVAAIKFLMRMGNNP